MQGTRYLPEPQFGLAAPRSRSRKEKKIFSAQQYCFKPFEQRAKLRFFGSLTWLSISRSDCVTLKPFLVKPWSDCAAWKLFFLKRWNDCVAFKPLIMKRWSDYVTFNPFFKGLEKAFGDFKSVWQWWATGVAIFKSSGGILSLIPNSLKSSIYWIYRS